MRWLFDTMEHPPQRFKRWYDARPDVAALIHRMNRLPRPYQELFGQIIIHWGRALTQEQRQNRQLLTLGPDKILRLLKAKAKRRWYDKNSILHRAYASLSLLDEAWRLSLIRRLRPGIRYVEEHLAQSQHPEDVYQTVARVIELVKNGDGAARSSTVPSPRPARRLPPEVQTRLVRVRDDMMLRVAAPE